MNALKQISAVMLTSIQTLPRRIGSSTVIVIGVIGVVAVLIAVLAMGNGLVTAVRNIGSDDRAIILRAGASAEATSILLRDEVSTILNSQEIQRDADGKALASADTLAAVNLQKKGPVATEVTIAMRGVGPGLQQVRPEIRLVSGRLFEPGKYELIVGQMATRQYSNLAQGGQISLRGIPWTVVGIFSTQGNGRESELLTDRDTLASVLNRGDFQSVTVRLKSAGAFAAFKASLAANPTLTVDAMRESDFFAQQSKDISKLVHVAAYGLGTIMGIGAIFAALNAMYAAVSARVREIAVFRAIGYGGELIVLSVVAEALFLALLGSVLGIAMIWLLLNGKNLNAGIGGSNTQLVFDVAVTPSIASIGVVAAAVIGVAGSFFPAIRAARVPVTTALREI
jgi:putative ABC transport system permease protein